MYCSFPPIILNLDRLKIISNHINHDSRSRKENAYFQDNSSAHFEVPGDCNDYGILEISENSKNWGVVIN